jgi:ubiquinone/menaquinone biosynthesis C-methylase UbiE
MFAPDISTRHTLTFIEKYTGRRNARLLEVGCGSGDLAAALMNSGMQVTAIDVSEEAIQFARAKNIDARCANVLTYEDNPFDVIVFSRSLHHIEPLGSAVSAAKRLMTAGGVLLIEDFAPETADEQAVEWLQLQRGAIPESLLNENARRHTKISTVDEWKEHHFGEHHVAEGASVRQAIEQQFPQVKVMFVPYLYRYVGDSIKADAADGAEIVQEIFNEEKEAIENNQLTAIGMRIVARR